VPLYTVAEAARFLGVPSSSFGNWARGYKVTFRTRPPVVGESIVTSLEAPRLYPTIPFIGLAEGFVVHAFRRAGVSLQHIRKAVAVLEKEVGIRHALASQQLFTDGASVLYDYAEHEGDAELLTHVVTQQRVLADVVRDYLRERRLAREAPLADDLETRRRGRSGARLRAADLPARRGARGGRPRPDSRRRAAE
jgi:hypothetical protein